ncbi:MAG: DUF1491 family protein [Alphaproteobacteria bacterium]|jgi:hypothetical protein|nr:DUF1491 family protein [Alphaproteobacteria bacterium]
MDDTRLPTALWVEAHLRRLTQEGIPYYIANTGAYAAGTVLVKINGLEKGCRLLIQQRNLDGILGWADATKDQILEEKKADEYISRAVSRDPDIWVIETEDRRMQNPFEHPQV